MDSYDVFQAINASAFSFITIVSLLFCIIILVAQWKIYVKAGEPGWAILVPFYNSYVLFKITWGNGWMFLTTFIPCVQLVFLIITMFKLAKVFGKSGGFAVGLLFLSPIFYSILGFGNSEYEGA